MNDLWPTTESVVAVPRHGFSHHGRGAELFLIMLVNLLLKVVTLGLYHFWAKTRVRRYLWTQTAYQDERFEYTGTGLDLLIGALVATLVLLVAGVAGALVLAALPLLAPLLALVGFLLVLWLVGAARFGAARYRLRHTRWRGIRFAVTGSAARHGGLFLGYSLLTAVTLGLAYPYSRIALSSHLINSARFGTEPFRFQGRGGDLMGRWLLAWLLLVPTLGLSFWWYRAAEIRYVADGTALGPMRFQVSIGGLGLLFLAATNLLALVFTLGLAYPWVLVRSTRYVAERTTTEGELDYTAVRQSEAEATPTGEGFAEALDLGGI